MVLIISDALQGVGEFRSSASGLGGREGAVLPPGRHGQGHSPQQCNPSSPWDQGVAVGLPSPGSH